MKKTNAYLIIMIMAIWSCSTFEEPEDPNQLSDARVSQIFTMSTSEQKMAFEMLSAKEKAKVWTSSVNNALRGEHFTRAQRSVVQELLTFIGEDMPQDPRTIASFESSWLKKAEKVLDEDKIYSLAYKINNNTGMHVEDPNDPTIPSCNCHRGSAWSCGPITVEWWCPDAPSNCKKPTMTGCGFMWLYSCNQVCVFEPL